MSDSADRIAYWKWLQLGDHLQRPETITPIMSTARFIDVPWARNASVQQTQASARTDYVLKPALYRENEDLRVFQHRILDFSRDLINASASTKDSVGQLGGELCVIECRDHITTTAGDIGSGGPTVNLTADVGFIQGEYALLTNDSDTWEVVEVTAVAGIEIAINTVNAWLSGSKIARLLYHVPRSHLGEGFTLDADSDTAQRLRSGSDLRFTSVDDALHL